MSSPAALASYLRFPAVSGDRVVFCCEDDLWTVPVTGGAASRLTAGTAESTHPRISSDGTLVAFVGAEDGPTEVYVMPLAGGPARQLTFQAARCVVTGWLPTGEIVYASTAEQPRDFGFRLFAVRPDGGPARLLLPGAGNVLAYGPGAAVVLGRSTSEPARWKRYRGGGAGELWIDSGGTGAFTPLLSLAGNLGSPCWVGSRIYFISDHEGIGNVYSCRPDGGDLAAHSTHTEFYARNLTADPDRLVYHAGGRLYLITPDGGPAASRPLEVSVARLRTESGRRFVPAADYLEGARLSPDGSSLAIITRGKAFSLAHWSGPVRQHGHPDGMRYRLLNWLADGSRLIAVAADERPDERLVLLAADGGQPDVEIQLPDVGYVTELLAAPAAGLVAFTTNRQQLWVVNTDDSVAVPRLLDSCVAERIEDLAWSADGRWLAYTYPDSALMSSIRVADVVPGVVRRVSSPVLRDWRPAFDPGGRYLYFLGQRELVPELDQVQFDVGFPFGCKPYLVTLREADASPFDGSGDAPDTPPFDPPDEPVPVEIDFDGIERRVVALPVPEGRYAGVLGLYDKVLVLGVAVTAPNPAKPTVPPQGRVSMVDLATAEVTEDYLSPVDEFAANARGTVLLYRVDHRLRVVGTGGDSDPDDEYNVAWAVPGRDSGWVDLERIRLTLRPAAEWRQMFTEAWRLQSETFWRPDMSGVDWKAMLLRYGALLPRIASRAELSDLLWELQGELATSHAYERGGDHRRRDAQRQGFLGVDFDRTATGRWRIDRILLGDPWNPAATSACNRPGAGIRPGDVLCAVNGQPVGDAGPGELLVGQAGREVELTLTRDAGEPRRVAVRALSDDAPARYRDWVRGNREYVHAASGGRLGYLHIPDMFKSGYAEFVRSYLAELDRDGLLVDVRFNGGGHISPLLLDRLARARAGAEHGRWSGIAPYPGDSAAGPMAVLMNEQTGSDGEIFSHRFRAQGLGRLVGSRTWGGVVATWPRHELVDGTVTTQPEFCYFFADIGNGLENYGVQPDVEVVLVPSYDASDKDPQVAAAVCSLMTDLDGHIGGPSDAQGAERFALSGRAAAGRP